MRALLLLLLVVLAFLAVRWFGPAREASAEEPEAAPIEAGVRFLTPPAQAEVSAPETPPAADPQPRQEQEASSEILQPESGPEDEIRAAAALLHGTPAEVQEAAAGLARDRALLLESFAWAMAGERKLALSLYDKAKKGTVDGSEAALLEAAMTGRAAATPASSGAGPVALAMEMALLAREGRQALEARQFPLAARCYSSLLLGELQAPWAADPGVLTEWTQGLDTAQRDHRWSPRSDWPAAEMKVQSGDSLIKIRQRYLSERPDARMCTGLIERANRLKGFLQPDQVLKVPTDPVSIRVDLEARWALYLLGDEVAAAWPVGIGRPGEDTPPGRYQVRNKLENPPWMKEGQEPIPFGDPRNPLGTRWIGWSTSEGAKTSYGFHGTWEPESVGQAASDGCVRLLNEDVEELFQILPEGAPILVEG